MTAHGEALLTSDAPKRYAVPTTVTVPVSAAPPAAEADPQDGPEQDDTLAQTADAEHETDITPEAEGASAAVANGDAPQPDAHDTTAENAANPAAPQAADAPTPRTTRGRKPKS